MRFDMLGVGLSSIRGAAGRRRARWRAVIPGEWLLLSSGREGGCSRLEASEA